VQVGLGAAIPETMERREQATDFGKKTRDGISRIYTKSRADAEKVKGLSPQRSRRAAAKVARKFVAF
jgi:hypothetical protein